MQAQDVEASAADASGERRRSRAWSLLDNPVIWETSRVGLDLAFGLYRKRVALLRQWGLLDGGSVLDVGCGIGQYAKAARGPYLGLDLNPRYIEYARKRRGGPDREFRAADVTEVHRQGERFDLVLMVDFLHHLPDEVCASILDARALQSSGAIVSFEPVTQQSSALGRWIVEHDRGDHVRPLEGLLELFDAAGLERHDTRELRLGPIDTIAIRAIPGR
jgi:2-polyprenyl-3-methyl-5-hydroxy-6-metoxy-1,4-benzoquinol methylase